MRLYKYFIGLIILLFNPFLLADVLYINIANLTKHAHDVVEGKVIKVEQKWDKHHEFIYTYTTIKVIKSFKKKIQNDEITIKEIGGQLKGYTTFAPCQPEYIKNENVLIFLQKDENYYHTYALNQGKFCIKTINKETIVRRNIMIDKITILDKNIKKADIKSKFTYNEILAIINNNL